MKAIELIKTIVENGLHLFYAICTNDMIVCSKQASNIEIFILAFFVESHRLFIVDTVAAKNFNKFVIEDGKAAWQSIKLLYFFIFIQSNEKEMYEAMDATNFETLPSNQMNPAINYSFLKHF